MNNTPQTNEAAPHRSTGCRNHIAGAVALLSLAVIAGAWLWITHQPPQPAAGLGLPHSVVAVGVVTFILGVLAEIRSMSFWDVLELVWEAVLGVFSLVGAVLKGIWNFICGLFGW